MGEVFAVASRSTASAACVGTTTAGAVAASVFIPLSDGSALQLSVEQVYSGGGALLDRVGVHPDDEVALDLDELRQGRDAQLERALDYLRTQAAAPRQCWWAPAAERRNCSGPGRKLCTRAPALVGARRCMVGQRPATMRLARREVIRMPRMLVISSPVDLFRYAGRIWLHHTARTTANRKCSPRLGMRRRVARWGALPLAALALALGTAAPWRTLTPCGPPRPRIRWSPMRRARWRCGSTPRSTPPPAGSRCWPRGGRVLAQGRGSPGGERDRVAVAAPPLRAGHLRGRLAERQPGRRPREQRLLYVQHRSPRYPTCHRAD